MSLSSKPVPIAIPNALLAIIDKVAEKMGKSKQEVMRLAMEIGLEHLKAIDYDVAAAVISKAWGSGKVAFMDETRMKQIFGGTHGLQDGPSEEVKPPPQTRNFGLNSPRKR